MITGHKPPASCIVDAEVRLHPGAQLGHGVIITGDVDVRDGVHLGHYCIIEGAPDRKTVIDHDTILEDYVRVYPGVSIGANSRVEAYSILGHPTKADLMNGDVSQSSDRVRDLLVAERQTLIGPGAVIRSHSVIYTHVEIGASLNTGQGIMIREHTRIGDGCVFGTHASTDGYCRIGPMGHIGQYSQLSQAARLGKGVFIGGHTVFSDNVQAVRDVSADLFGATVADYARVGLNCVILPSVQIHSLALVGAGSVVTRDVPERALAYGNPARIARQLTEEEVQSYLSSVNKD